MTVLTLCASASSFSMDIFDAIEYGNYKEVEQLIKDKKVDVNKANNKGWTPLYLACENGYIELVRLLLANGVKKSVNRANNKGWTPLHRACSQGNIDILKLLLANGAKKSVNRANNDGETPLIWVCCNNNIDIVKLLLEYGAKESINKATQDGQTPLYWACSDKNIDIVKLLLEYDVKENVNKADKDGRTLLYQACMNNNIDIVKLLLEYGAKESVNEVAKDGETPLYWACWNVNIDLVKLLFEYGAIVDKKSEKLAQKNNDIKPYIDAVLQYDAQETNKLQFVLSMQNKPELFNFLVRVAFGRISKEFSSNTYESLKSTTFFKLYDLIKDKNNFEEIFGVKRKINIIEFIKEVLKDKNKNFFIMDGSFLRKYEFFGKLNAKRDENKLVDCSIILE